MLALTPAMKKAYQLLPASMLYYSAVEHPSALSGGRFPVKARREIPVTKDGLLDLAVLREMLEVTTIQWGGP